MIFGNPRPFQGRGGCQSSGNHDRYKFAEEEAIAYDVRAKDARKSQAIAFSMNRCICVRQMTA